MNKSSVAAFRLAVFAFAPWTVFASYELAEIKHECRHVAIEEGVPSEDQVDFVVDCVYQVLAHIEAERAQEAVEPAIPQAD